MRSWRCAGKFALVVVLGIGCARQGDDADSRQTGTVEQTASVSRGGASPPNARPEETDSSETSALPALTGRPAVVTLSHQTVMGQPLPAAIKNEWLEKLRQLADENPSLVRIAADRAEAEWLVQAAALERADILYLSPLPADGSEPDDESLRMSPPGEAALSWLKEELAPVAREAALRALLTSPSLNELAAEAEPAAETSSQDDPPVDPLAGTLIDLEGEPRAEKADSPAAPEADADADADERMAELQRQRDAMEQLRREYDQHRFEAAGAKAGEILFHHGPPEDFRAEIVKEQGGVYHTANRTQAVLGAYGKLVDGNRLRRRLARFEHRGLVARLERVRRFTTVDREGRSAGKDFVSLVGTKQEWQIVDFVAQLSAGRHQEIAFEIVGVRLDQSDVIKALNADAEALSYFAYLREQSETPCLVLENLVFTSYAAARDADINVGGKAKTILTSDGLSARTGNRRSSYTQFALPVVRCYQPYEVKLHGREVVELVYLNP